MSDPRKKKSSAEGLLQGIPGAPEVRNTNVDVLRGFAALAVALYHFSRSDYLGNSLLGHALHFGYLGVHAFFVVSGFVIPLALARARGGINPAAKPNRLWHRFLINRWLRLYPAFAASALLTIALWYVSAWMPNFRGGQPSFSWAQLFSNATLSCDLTNTAWINPVFWTLGVEAQYYIIIALCITWLSSSRRWLRSATLLLWIAAPLIAPWHGTFLPFGATFALGIIFFQKSIGLISTVETTLWAAAAILVSILHGDFAIAGASGASFLFLAIVPQLKWRLLLSIGAVSYSLYLLHVPIGGRIINLSEHFTLPWIGRVGAVAAALAASLAAAAIFYRLIEKPSHEAARRWSR